MLQRQKIPTPSRIFVAKKPRFVSSNAFLQNLKKRLNLRDLGYSGTLDPFASGVLVVASGQYTRLLGHLRLSPKIYRATLWLGAESPSLDSENIANIALVDEIALPKIHEVMSSLKGVLTYEPPRFSAKKINGIRAYKMARDSQDFALKPVTSEVFEASLLNYSHPFLSFEISVEKGAYIRSIAQIIAQKLGVCGTLSALERLREGDFGFEGYKNIAPLEVLPYEKLDLGAFKREIKNGAKLTLPQLAARIPHLSALPRTRYLAVFEEFFSIIEFNEAGEMRYILNDLGL